MDKVMTFYKLETYLKSACIQSISMAVNSQMVDSKLVTYFTNLTVRFATEFYKSYIAFHQPWLPMFNFCS